MNETMQKHVHTLITKAADAETSDAAMKFAQAACNAANAMATLADIKKQS